MSTRSATIIRQTTYWGEQADTEELMRFYRHCDGYPEGHGADMVRAIRLADKKGIAPEHWVQGVLEFFFCRNVGIEFEPKGCQHGDLDYLYVIDGIVDRCWGRTKDDRLPVIISVYDICWDEDYEVAMERTPIFSGTAYEYIEKFGKEQQWAISSSSGQHSLGRIPHNSCTSRPRVHNHVFAAQQTARTASHAMGADTLSTSMTWAQAYRHASSARTCTVRATRSRRATSI